MGTENKIQECKCEDRTTKYHLTVCEKDSLDIEKRFTYHPPKPGQQERYIAIRNMAKDLAYVVDQMCPESREKSTAMTKLDEVVMFANAAIARNE